MRYCVRCGVELGEDLKECPLCHTPVIDPDTDCPGDAPPFFPTSREPVGPVSKRAAAVLLTAMLASVAVCCGLLNLLLHPETAWFLYAAGAAAMLWIWFVPPLLIRALPGWPRLAINICAVALYVFLIAIACHGQAWYVGLALPILLVTAAVSLGVSWLTREGRCSTLTSIVFVLVGIGLIAIAAEFFFDRFFFGAWRPAWSLIVTAVCVGLSIPLIVVRRVPSLREEARRRFHR